MIAETKLSNLIKWGKAVVLLCTMAFLCSCANFGDDDDRAQKTGADVYVYDFEDLGIELLKNNEYISLNYDSSGIYGLKKSNNDGHINYSFSRIKNGQTRAEEILIGSGNTRFDYLCTDNNDNFYVLRTIYPDKKGVDNINDDYEYSGKGEKKLVKYSPSGDQIWAAALTTQDAAGYIRDMAYVKEIGILTCSTEGLSLYDELTGEGKAIVSKDKGDIHGDRELLVSPDGTVYAVETDSSWKYIVYEFDTKKMNLGKKYNIPKEVPMGAKFFTGTDNDFYYIDKNCIYAFNKGDEKTRKICDLIDSAFYADNIVLLFEKSEDEYEIIADYNTASSRAFSMRKKDSQSDEKKSITIGITTSDSYVRQQVNIFNQENREYNIILTDYTENSLLGYHSAYGRLLEDMQKGKGPDILILSSYSDMCDLRSKGFLEPIDSYLRNDVEISSNKYIENIAGAIKENGKQFAIMPYFSINTCAASSEFLGDEAVSLSNYRNLCNKHNVKIQNVMGTMNFAGADILYETSGFDFIDIKEKTCDFQNYNFINLISLIREVKRAEDSDIYKPLDSNCYIENKSMLLPYVISSFEDYRIIRDGYFKSDIFFNGYPSIGGGISYIEPGMMLSINSRSEYKEKAYEFIRYFLLDEYQYSIEWGFPVYENALDLLMDKSTRARYYIDDSGKRVDTNSTITIGKREFVITPLTTSEASYMKEFICSLNKLQYRDPEIVSLISESVKPYYIGDITAEKASSLVQHRIEKYLKDNNS
ncbi:ABC-type glycerol-3-phosphate transport system, substrate-binding protein [Butyrivibrio sp. ob235]|nr:ABC-type glycerol-3-phosphate transport system, substrate-binding protein [Butyrivibrio sp. ob235]